MNASRSDCARPTAGRHDQADGRQRGRQRRRSVFAHADPPGQARQRRTVNGVTRVSCIGDNALRARPAAARQHHGRARLCARRRPDRAPPRAADHRRLPGRRRRASARSRRGFTAIPTAIHQLAEFGVILLMFGVGLHFSFRDLWQVRDIAIPGALVQMLVDLGARLLRWRGAGASRPRGALGVRPRDVGGEHGRADARPDGPRLARHAARQGRDRLARVRGSRDRRDPRAAARARDDRSSTSVLCATAALAIGKALLFVALMLFVGTRADAAAPRRHRAARDRASCSCWSR